MITYLVVDDSATIRATLGASIAAARPAATVIQAGTAKEALALIHAEKPDVIFLDMMLTESGGGLELAGEIGAINPHTRIIITTGLAADHPDVTNAISMGAFAYVQKPIRRQGVASVLDDIDEEDHRLRRIR